MLSPLARRPRTGIWRIWGLIDAGPNICAVFGIWELFPKEDRNWNACTRAWIWFLGMTNIALLFAIVVT